jgi:hypothetical protein
MDHRLWSFFEIASEIFKFPGSDYPRPKLSMLSAHAKFAEIHGGYATRNLFKLFENFIKIRDELGMAWG